MMGTTERILRRLRSSQPFNRATTTILKGVFSAAGAIPVSLVKHLPREGLVSARLPNGAVLRLLAGADGEAANAVFWKGWSAYEPETSVPFFRLATQARVSVDVGAHIGYYSVLAALANPRATVLAFEPLAEANARLRRNIAINGLTSIHVFDCALGSACGHATLYSQRNPTGIPSSSGLSARFFGLPYYVGQGVTAGPTVAVAALDDIIDDLGRGKVDLVKIDTETTEPEVVSGMLRTIERDHPDIVVEVLPGQGTAPVLSRQLSTLGYSFYLLGDGRLMARTAIVEHSACWNHLATVRPCSEVGGLLRA